MTVRLPESLHQQLQQLADLEDVSLNHYIVYALTRQVTQQVQLQQVPAHVLAEERIAAARQDR
jgi:predicted transcriptional regulator